ncbi:hypothetical protein [Ursidibacter sp. B-7004-1]
MENKTKSSGLVAGVIACVLAVLGILFLGIVFIPLAAITATIGSVTAIKHKNLAGIGVNIFAWLLTLVGLFTSPILLAAIGLGGIGLSQ